MVTLKGRYSSGQIALDEPLDLPDGTAIEVVVRPVEEAPDADWRELGMARLEAEWDNPRDAVYDDWRALYGVPKS